jgi:hypothetical protein
MTGLFIFPYLTINKIPPIVCPFFSFYDDSKRNVINVHRLAFTKPRPFATSLAANYIVLLLTLFKAMN